MENYDDIINMEYPRKTNRARLSISERAAQFAPFSALDGYEDAIDETERLTEQKIELDENEKFILNEKLRILADNISSQPEATFLFFIPDEKKQGGMYVEKKGNIKRIDEASQTVILTDKTKIHYDDILNIHSELLIPYNLLFINHTPLKNKFDS